jgi:cytochrome c oxidase subunit 2
VRFNLTSDDVIHSFWIPGFLYKRDLVPGQVQSFDVDLGDQTGEWQGRCAEFCGIEHFSMHFTLRIVTDEAFAAWVAGQ